LKIQSVVGRLRFDDWFVVEKESIFFNNYLWRVL
jgi:hypothetical protein